MKLTICFAFTTLFYIVTNGQLMVSKRLGKNSDNSRLGYGTFVYWDFPISGAENKSVRLELFDLEFYQDKNDSINTVIGYISIKLGYKYIFSETQTGIFIEPQAGWCRVVNSAGADGSHGDGIALAFETGYSLEVGQRNNAFIFGLKYEADLAGANYTCSSVGLRFSYTFHLARKRED
ncbi:MAG TPA: hypothetical protein VFI29_15100 [Hanamia sp.]|nr:hypothetical protein [Hanamia sp.]